MNRIRNADVLIVEKSETRTPEDIPVHIPNTT